MLTNVDFVKGVEFHFIYLQWY